MKNRSGVEYKRKKDVGHDPDKRTCDVCGHYDYPIKDGWRCRYCGALIGINL